MPAPHPAHRGAHWRVWSAEAAGTALMVLAILLAAGLALGDGSPVAEALPGRGARFLALGAMVGPCVALIAISPLGRLSGAHVNPAVTLGFWVLGRVGVPDLVGYVAAQLLGGLVGALLGRLLLPSRVAQSIGGAVTHPTISTPGAIALEAGMTAALLVLVFGFVSSARLARWTPLALIPLLTAIIWLGSPWTGASLNPARSEGPAVAFGDLLDLWLYFVAPAGGALVVAGSWRLRDGAPRPKTASCSTIIAIPASSRPSCRPHRRTVRCRAGCNAGRARGDYRSEGRQARPPGTRSRRNSCHRLPRPRAPGPRAFRGSRARTCS